MIEKERCISEGVDSLLKAGERPRKSGEHLLRPVIRYFQEHDFILLQADKEGGFVVLPRGFFSEKALQAVEKNFKKVTLKPQKVKTEAIKLLKDLNLERLGKEGRQTKKYRMTVFFAARPSKLIARYELL